MEIAETFLSEVSVIIDRISCIFMAFSKFAEHFLKHSRIERKRTESRLLQCKYREILG